MQNKLEIFKNEQFGEIRTVIIGGEPWFVLKDVCEVLEIQNSGNVFARLDEDEKGIHSMDTLGGNQEMSIVSESGLYKIIFQSRKENALKFQSWVTKDVIPKIRKTGMYANVPKSYSEALRMYANEVEQKELMQTQRDEAIRTKAWIGNRREATAMASASAFKRKSDALEIELDKSKKFATVKLCEIKTKRKFDWHKLRNYCTSHELEMKKVFDSNYGKINSYPAEAWANVYSLDIENLAWK
jgi:prophage antirepressor-like protein